MPFGSKRAGLLERSLQGYETTDQEIQNLVATAGRISSLSPTAGAPREEFVSALGIRLRAEALTHPARQVRPVAPVTVGRRPMVFVIGRGLPRILAGAAASVLLVGAVVGGTSRSALPGGLLYPVKQLLNSAEVQLAGSDFDRGMTLLSQAQEHLSDAAALVDRDGAQADPASVNEALLGAYDAVIGGQRALLGEFDRTSNAQALVAIQDFTVRARPQLDALRPRVPAGSKPDLEALIALLQDGRTSLARKVALCGEPCASLDEAVLGSSPLSAPGLGLSSTPAPGEILGNAGGLTPGGLPTAGGVPTAGGLPAPGSAVTAPGGVVVVPSVPPLLITTGGSIGVNPPPVTVGPGTITPSAIVPPPIVLPPIVIPTIPPILQPLPLPLPLPIVPSVITILPPTLPVLPPILPTALPGLP